MRTGEEQGTVGLLFFGRKRPGFDMEWSVVMEARVRTAMAGLSSRVIVASEKAVDAGSLRRMLRELRDAGAEVVVSLQTTMADGRLAPLIPRDWSGDIVLWATPERPDGDMVSSCSLVGAHVFGTTFRQLGIPFEFVYGAPEDEETLASLQRAVAAARGARGAEALLPGILAGATVGLIGYHAPGFINMHADPAVLSKGLGVQARHIGLQEFCDEVNDIPEGEVTDDLDVVHSFGLPMDGVEASDFPLQSRYYLAMKRLVEQEGLDALAIRCWPELPNTMGQWPYFAMVRLTTEGYPNAMEGDVDGALSCLLGERMGFGRGYLTDWLEHRDDVITLWHPGNAPLDLCDPIGSPHGPRLMCHFNIRRPMVVTARVRPGEAITLFRLWHCDNQYFLMAHDAETRVPGRNLQGTFGEALLAGQDLPALFSRLCHAGMPHHLAVFPGHHTVDLREEAHRAGIQWVD